MTHTRYAFVKANWHSEIVDQALTGFTEIIPAIEFPRSASFKDRASLILRIELFFSGSIDRVW